jgi:hypothetical protein
VKITDANNCFIVKDFTLQAPSLLPVGLGADKVLCKEQVHEINATVNDPNISYQWFKNGIAFPAGPIVQLTEPATYKLKVTDRNGCTNEDDIKISYVDIEIAADFVVATRVPKGERVRITNISNPAPDKSEWIIPSGVRTVDEKLEYVELIFDSYGEFGLRSFKADCEKTAYKTVKVVPKSELSDYETPDEPFIKQFIVAPNANNGKFTATVELREPATFKLIFYSGQGNVIAEKEIRHESFSAVDFDVSSSVSAGIYMLQLVTAQGVSTFKVMIN